MTSTVYIAKNVYGGDGLGRLGDGRVIFVPGAWTGENVKAEIVGEKRHFVKARLVEVVEASAERIDGGESAAIPGCVYANLSYAAEFRTKEAQLREFFERARLGFDPERIEFAGFEASQAAAAAGYRNKAVYHFERRGGAWVIGYRTEPSHTVVDVAHDPLVVPAINAKLPEIRKAVLALLTTGPVSVRRDIERKGNVTVRWSERSGVKWWIGDAPKDVVIKETTCGRVFEVPAGGFYQVNPVIGELLVRAVADEVAKGGESAADILDLYCGVGVFGLCCVRGSGRLTGVESGREAIEFAKRNAVAQKREARFFAEQVGRNVDRLPLGPRTTVIVDPPRGGMEPNVPKALAAAKAPRILYVSCDPATLVRDLKTICRGYDIESVKGFDMFPRTARFETLVTLKRK